MTVDSLKLLFSSPLALLALMVLASVGNGIKQIAVVRQTGQPMKCIEYWSHVPETLTVVIGNILAFILLIVTDQLNVASALAVGYGTNSLADLLPKGRSYALKSTPDTKL
jgi:Na+/alanine symporter